MKVHGVGWRWERAVEGMFRECFVLDLPETGSCLMSANPEPTKRGGIGFAGLETGQARQRSSHSPQRPGGGG